MGLFSKKTTKSDKTEKAVKVAKKTTTKAVAKVATDSTNANTGFDFSSIIIKPRITEKAGIVSESHNVYTFEVTKLASKGQIKKAVQSLYKVVPTKVNMINLPPKNVLVRGKKGVVKGVRKALVTLKKGDKIEFI